MCLSQRQSCLAEQHRLIARRSDLLSRTLFRAYVTEMACILAFRLGAELHRLKGLTWPVSLHFSHESSPKMEVLGGCWRGFVVFALVSPWCAAVKCSPSSSYHREVKRNLQVMFQTWHYCLPQNHTMNPKWLVLSCCWQQLLLCQTW